MRLLLILPLIIFTFSCQALDQPISSLKVHGIFRSNMVLQRAKPIKVWGWAPKGSEVKVQFGSLNASDKADGEGGLWEVTFEAQQVDSKGRNLTVTCGDNSIKMKEILIGDVWVMNGQSNMAFALKAVYQNHFEASMANLPLLRQIRINSGAESEHEEKDIKDNFINGSHEDKNWIVSTPETVMDMSAIGYIFGSRLQRSLQIPIGIIDNARGGASLESLVPRHQFANDPQASEYLKWVDKRNSEFSEKDFLQAQMDKYKTAFAKYQKQLEDDKKKGVKKNRHAPRKPNGSIRTWSVPGRSPSDAASCYNGMFGVFKGLNIKGVAFHQGFNNSMMNTSCKPVFYRKLMKLMIEGWREDFNDPALPVAIIGFCAGGQAQTHSNFEQMGFSTAALIREAQRLGLGDVKNQENTVYIANYDQQIPQLHTKKKKELGIRTARWALNNIYGNENIVWDTAKLVSAEAKDGKMLLTFDKAVRPDNFSSIIEGFSLAGKDGIYYMAQAEAIKSKDKNLANKQILVSSPIVSEPLTVRYAWARSPMGNLKVNGIPWQPLPCFRTDNSSYKAEVSHMDPDGNKKCSDQVKIYKLQAADALKKRLEAGK